MKNNQTNNTIVTGIPESLIRSNNVPHPADHPELFEMCGDKYVYVGPDDFKETVKTIEVKDNCILASDPAYCDEEYRKLGTLVENARNGIWTVDYSGPNLRATNRDYKLARFKAGEDDFIEWTDAIGMVYVDTGLAGFFADLDIDLLAEEIPNCDYRYTLRGDGGYPVLAKYDGDEVVTLEITYDGGTIFNYHHGIVSEEDQLAAITAVESANWAVYNELAEKYNRMSCNYSCFSGILFVGHGCLPLTEETFPLADLCEFECG